MENIYLRNKSQCFEPVYVPAENYSFYMNFLNIINDPDFANFELRLYKEAAVVHAGFGILMKHLIRDNFYNIYCDFVFPATPNGEYQFVIYDNVKNIEKARSNYILVANQDYTLITQRLEYSNELNDNNFYYESLPGFTNKFRLPLSKIDYQFASEKKQYRNITNGKLRTFQNFRNKVIKVESYYFDEGAHEAMSAVADCSNVIIGGTHYVPRSAYTVNGNQLDVLNKGEFEAYEDEDAVDEKVPIAKITLNQSSLQKIGDIIALTGLAAIDRGFATNHDFYANNIQEPAQPQNAALHNYGNWLVLINEQEFKVLIAYQYGVEIGQVEAVAAIEGVYPLFATTVDAQTATEQPLLSMKISDNIQILLAAETLGDKQFVDIPTDWYTARPLVGIEYYVDRLGQFILVNKISDFVVTNVTHVVAGNVVNYKRVKYKGINRGQTLIKLKF